MLTYFTTVKDASSSVLLNLKMLTVKSSNNLQQKCSSVLAQH